MSDTQILKERVEAAIDTMRDVLVRIADTIHAHPEVAFEETESAALLSGTLENHGFQVQRGQFLPAFTGFASRLRDSGGR